MNQEFIRNIKALKHDEGKRWLDKIPEIIEEYEKKWSIKILPPFHLSYNYVAPAIRSNGQHLVLKIGFPGDIEFEIEIEALKAFNGDGVISLFDFDTKNNVMLIERAEPGIPISQIEDDEVSTKTIISLMKKLWKPNPKNSIFPTLKDFFKAFDRLRTKYHGKTGPLPEKIISAGEELYKHLIRTSSEAFILHGDLHHDNVLSAKREPYLAIDPQSVIGEKAHETAAMLRNPQSKLHKFKNPKQVLLTRIAILSEELDINRERIRQWGIAQTILSAVWKLEDGGTDWNYCIKIAELLLSIKG